MKNKLLYQGHASVRITTREGKVIYIDPFAGKGYDKSADLILITHAHFDHTAIARIKHMNDDCRIISNMEALAGGKHNEFDLGYIKVKSVAAGNNKNHDVKKCVGYVLTFSDGIKVYFSGDTSFVPEMKDMRSEALDYAFFCCDGVYNMDLEEAAYCAEVVGAGHNVPYHVVATDTGDVFDIARAKAFKAPNALIIKDGEEIEL